MPSLNEFPNSCLNEQLIVNLNHGRMGKGLATHLAFQLLMIDRCDMYVVQKHFPLRKVTALHTQSLEPFLEYGLDLCCNVI